MLWTLSVVLVFLWVVGLVSGVHVGAWTHALLLLAAATVVVQALRRARVVGDQTAQPEAS